MKILVTVGTQVQPFNRIGEIICKIAPEHQITFQYGKCTFIPDQPNISCSDYLLHFNTLISEHDLIITHGGVGTIMNSVAAHKKVIAVPRLKKYGEHVDDHQLEIVEKFADLDYIYYLKEAEDINEVIAKVMEHDFSPYKSEREQFATEFNKILQTLDQH